MFNKDEVDFLREQVRILQEANFRLTELLARKSGYDLVLPRPSTEEAAHPSPTTPGPPSTANVDLWWKANVAGHAISSPVREVGQPKSKSKEN